ncbi:hypothetical protein LWI28_018826 [Acer negundo]|uniref:Uncharacterized protein n=1 Tax=Acer negundo TaxID=4023 RepID=A0AAD5JPS1_ACENE|nr:hypothetical protein LWI28_018826 [Acer negundo]
MSAPPRLFLLDKFDVAVAGACLPVSYDRNDDSDNTEIRYRDIESGILGKDSQQKASNGVEDYLTDEIQELLSTLPREKSFDGSYLHQYQGFWYRSIYIAGMISAHRHFQARDSDTILITCPKSGKWNRFRWRRLLRVFPMESKSLALFGNMCWVIGRLV